MLYIISNLCSLNKSHCIWMFKIKTYLRLFIMQWKTWVDTRGRSTSLDKASSSSRHCTDWNELCQITQQCTSGHTVKITSPPPDVILTGASQTKLLLCIVISQLYYIIKDTSVLKMINVANFGFFCLPAVWAESNMLPCRLGKMAGGLGCSTDGLGHPAFPCSLSVCPSQWAATQTHDSTSLGVAGDTQPPESCQTNILLRKSLN